MTVKTRGVFICNNQTETNNYAVYLKGFENSRSAVHNYARIFTMSHGYTVILYDFHINFVNIVLALKFFRNTDLFQNYDQINY